MRILLSLAALFIMSAQALAEQWQQFGVERFGFIFDVPPGFTVTQRAEDGSGASFQGTDGALIVVKGAELENRNFRDEIEQQIKRDERDGWRITYKRVTSKWASFSGLRNGEIRYVRVITVCEGRAAVFLLDYDQANKIPYDPLVKRMVRSFKREGC